jgi:aspartyl-tRNA(Asn)/glutamyl-tRNA(Gln) amidotransferase subunit C
MSLNNYDIQKIAHLARLAVTDEEAAIYAQKLSSAINLIDQLKAANTDNISPVAHSFQTSQRLREDDVVYINQREKLQAIAPNVEAGLYLVPKVIE